MAKAKTARKQDNSDFIASGDLNASMFWFGDLNVWGAFPTAPSIYQKPRPQAFYVTRNWFERSVFIKAMTLLKFDIYNYGFKLQAANEPAATDSKRKAWEKKNEAVQTWFTDNKQVVMQLVRDAWSEWLIMDNIIAVWMKGMPPVMQGVEHVSFDDLFGIEQLSFAHGMTADQVARLPRKVSAVMKQAMAATSNLTITKQGKIVDNDVFTFEALRRTRVGLGLAWPQLRTVFNSVGMWESLEVADWQLADALRTVYELHKIGHEIKNGPRAGFPDHFWKKKRADAINKMIKPDSRLLSTIKRLVVQFDHQVEYPRPDAKHFEMSRYAAPLERLCYWAMPIAQALFAKQVNPWHGNFMKAKAHTERDYVGPFLEKVMKECLHAPEGTTAVWSDEIFLDPRLMMDALKTGLTSGPISQETFLERTGHSAHVERARKDNENDLPEHQTRPLWDGAHGINPNDPEGGRPAGSGDKNKRGAKTS